ncbi:hypothetical protein [Peribacillus kribbensis]|uniref:WYL domain-containing protein n=1 Tax=Peribacillus kribbensis TaxID=356658 RepID=UPI00041462CB|nr:hypothetical protein [Peribacillus kribbensis]
MKGLINRSLEEKKPLEIIYLKGDQQISQRTILVLSVNGDYIRAFCYLRNQKRTFKMSNILSAVPSRKRLDLLAN